MKRIALLLLLCLAFAGCQGVFSDEPRQAKRWNSVMILYSVGMNDLSPALASDMKELKDVGSGAYLPKRSSDRAIVIISHQPVAYNNFSTPTSPVIEYVYAEEVTGQACCDTFYRAPKGDLLTDPAVMKDLLEKVCEAFPSEHYGAIFSSHASGWLPEGYYSKGLSWDILSSAATPLVQVRSYGQEYYTPRLSTEMNIPDMAAAIPMHLDYLVLDACLLGGVEVAYEFKDVADQIAFSPAEVLGSGLNYVYVANHLLKPEVPDLQGLCEDFYKDYSSSSVTTTLVRTAGLDELASVCRNLFEKYRSAIACVNPARIQKYYRYNCHWFYDLEDILAQSGVVRTDLQPLWSALEGCVEYKKWTPVFLGFKIERSCGLSMYLPANGSSELDEFYKGLKWNRATSLVE